MANKIKISLLFLIVLLIIPSIAFASENNETQIVAGIEVDYVPIKKVVNISKNVQLNVLEDGRILPVKNVHDLDEEQMDQILSYANFTADELDKMSLKDKQEFAAMGGMKVDSEATLVQRYHSLDGNVYEINDENRDTIEKIKQRDLRLLGLLLDTKGSNDNEFSPFASCGVGTTTCYQNDGNWTAHTQIVYVGTSGKDYIYTMRLWGEWKQTPLAAFKDRAAIAADSYHRAVSGGTTGQQCWRTSSGQQCTSSIETKPHTNYTEWAFYVRSASPQHFYGTQQFYIDQARSGHNHTIGASYIHPWSPVNPGITVRGVNISWTSFIGDEWTWTHSYRVR